MRSKVCALLTGFVLLATAGCGNTGPGGSCASVEGTATMAWPAAGATGVDPTIGVIFLGPVAAVVSVTLNAGNTAIPGTINGATPSPLPSGAPSGGYAVTGDLSVTIPKLASATTYTVIADVAPGCSGTTGVLNLGSFTTK